MGISISFVWGGTVPQQKNTTTLKLNTLKVMQFHCVRSWILGPSLGYLSTNQSITRFRLVLSNSISVSFFQKQIYYLQYPPLSTPTLRAFPRFFCTLGVFAQICCSDVMSPAAWLCRLCFPFLPVGGQRWRGQRGPLWNRHEACYTNKEKTLQNCRVIFSV